MILQDGARALGIELSAGQLDAFNVYRSALIEWNQRFNLTTITDPAEIDVKHFLDSLSCLQVLPQLDGRPLVDWLAGSAAAVDVGAGAGFPGLPIKIVWPALRLTLIESTGKKCRFLAHVVDALGLEHVTVVHERVEDFGQGAGRTTFDLALARAVARLPVLLEYALPLLRIGGWLLAQKGRVPEEELAASQSALELLGGNLRLAQAIVVPGLDADRSLVVVAKERQTPPLYPRQAGTPQRRPL